MNKSEVYFCIVGDDFDPDIVTERIGIQPSRILRKGSPLPRFSSWAFSSGKVTSEIVDVYELSSRVIATLAPHAEAIRSVMEDNDLSAFLEVVLHISMDESLSTPAIGFDTSVVEFLAKIGASIDIDTYRS